MLQCPVHRKSDGRLRMVEARPLVRVSAVYSIQCFDADSWIVPHDGWVTRRTSAPLKPGSLNPFFSRLRV